MEQAVQIQFLGHVEVSLSLFGIMYDSNIIL
jgi:hypothetical protein